MPIQQATKFEDPEGFGFICEEQNYKSRSFVRFMICDSKNSGKKIIGRYADSVLNGF